MNLDHTNPQKRGVICVPVYNEKDTVHRCVLEIEKLNLGLDLLFIDDSSPDGTGDVIRTIAKEKTWVKILVRQKKEGLARAYYSAFDEIIRLNYDFLITLDADLSHSPEMIPYMIRIMNEGYPFVIGSRYVRIDGWPKAGDNRKFLRRMITRMAYLYVRLCTPLSVLDPTSGFNLITRDCLLSIPYRSCYCLGFGFSIEMKWMAFQKNIPLKEIPYFFKDRTAGKSNFSQRILLEALAGIWKARKGWPQNSSI